MSALLEEEVVRPLNNRIFLMRHGLAECNVQGILVSAPSVGITKFGLVDQGKMNATKAAEKFEANLTVQGTIFEDLTEKMVIVSSDFKRAIETAQILHSHFKLSTPIRTEVGLRERDFGEFDCTPWKDALPTIIENDKVNPSQRICGCESVPEMVARVTKVLKSIEEEYADKIVVIVSHSNPLQVLWAMCNNVPLVERFVELKHFQNCDIREYKFV